MISQFLVFFHQLRSLEDMQIKQNKCFTARGSEDCIVSASSLFFFV